jgi:hypothetical protein
MLDEEKPVATPGYVSCDWPEAGDVDFDRFRSAVGGNIFDGDCTVFVQCSSHYTNRSFNAVLACFYPAQVCEGDEQTNGSMAAHAEAAGVIEEDDAGDATGVSRFTEQGPNHSFKCSGFGDHGAAKGLVLALEAVSPFVQGSIAKRRSTIDDATSGLSTGVRINDSDLLQAHTSSTRAR